MRSWVTTISGSKRESAMPHPDYIRGPGPRPKPTPAPPARRAVREYWAGVARQNLAKHGHRPPPLCDCGHQRDGVNGHRKRWDDTPGQCWKCWCPGYTVSTGEAVGMAPTHPGPPTASP